MVTPVSARSRRTRAVDVEAVLLDAAHRLLEAEGVEALTVRRVAAEAGVAPMSLYHRFGGKAGLLDALFNDGFELLSTSMRDVPVGNALDELRGGGQQYRQFALANPALYSVMFDRVVPGFEPGSGARRACEQSFGVLVDCVRRAQAAGVIRSGDPVEFAQLVWTSCHGAVSVELRQLGFVEDRDAFYDGMITTLLDGLAPRE